MPSATEQAAKRLDAALRRLEEIIEPRLLRSADADGLAAEVAMLTADRARLAEDLDQSQARAVKLENTNREVSRRLAAAAETVRTVLDSEAER
jgi:hypothetical protein